jgi:hypothetical protein
MPKDSEQAVGDEHAARSCRDPCSAGHCAEQRRLPLHWDLDLHMLRPACDRDDGLYPGTVDAPPDIAKCETVPGVARGRMLRVF